MDEKWFDRIAIVAFVVAVLSAFTGGLAYSMGHYGFTWFFWFMACFELTCALGLMFRRKPTR